MTGCRSARWRSEAAMPRTNQTRCAGHAGARAAGRLPALCPHHRAARWRGGRAGTRHEQGHQRGRAAPGAGAARRSRQRGMDAPGADALGARSAGPCLGARYRCQDQAAVRSPGRRPMGLQACTACFSRMAAPMSRYERTRSGSTAPAAVGRADTTRVLRPATKSASSKAFVVRGGMGCKASRSRLAGVASDSRPDIPYPARVAASRRCPGTAHPGPPRPTKAASPNVNLPIVKSARRACALS